MSRPEIERIFDLQRAAHTQNSFPPVKERRQKLRRLRRAIERRSPDIERAIHADFRKAPAEVCVTEIFPVIHEIEFARKHLRRWMRPEPVPGSLIFPGARGEIRREPRGVCLIISPWNFPFQLAVGPLASALAAGNRVILKPSERSSNTSRFLKEFLGAIFDESEVAVVEGGPTVAQSLVELPFDHIFFTGGTAVGKIVMGAAAKNLTSVTLELGGKSPAILEASADLKAAARRICWGKFINAGQTCVAPDYLLVPERLEERFVAELRAALRKLYGDPATIAGNGDYCRLISSDHFARARALFDQAIARGARIAAGGIFDAEQRFVAPTILTGVAAGCDLLREEIFCPILPLLSYRDDDEAIARVRSVGAIPLALYLFSHNRRWIEKILAALPAGDAVVNDTVVHFVNPALPFGGVRESGLGKSHGYAGFLEFSHPRSVLYQARWPPIRLFYPPYTALTRRLINWTTRCFSGR